MARPRTRKAFDLKVFLTTVDSGGSVSKRTLAKNELWYSVAQ